MKKTKLCAKTQKIQYFIAPPPQYDVPGIIPPKKELNLAFPNEDKQY